MKKLQNYKQYVAMQNILELKSVRIMLFFIKFRIDLFLT